MSLCTNYELYAVIDKDNGSSGTNAAEEAGRAGSKIHAERNVGQYISHVVKTCEESGKQYWYSFKEGVVQKRGRKRSFHNHVG